MSIKRRKTRKVKVGSIYIGGNAPISIQSMAKADTRDVNAIVSEIKRLQGVGCEIVRVAVKDKEAAHALKDIKKRINIPLVADIHFDPRLAMLAIENHADKIRINPGNTKKNDLLDIANLAKTKKIPIRIGLNSGSTPKGVTMIALAQETIKLFQRCSFRDIIISLKSSNILETVDAYRRMAVLCDYPFHLGLTATGLPESGIVKSSICIGTLLLSGIGDTIRVSLTGDSVKEVSVVKTILSSLDIRRFGHEVISCPTCGRCQVDLEGIVKELVERLEQKGRAKGNIRPLRIAVMGCEVNGPGEARDSDIGIAAGKHSGVLFKKGKIVRKIEEKDFVDTLVKEIDTMGHS